MMDSFLITTLLAAIAGSIYLYYKWALSYWTRRGVESFDKNSVDFKAIMLESYDYFKSKNIKYGGIYTLLKPSFLPLDLDLLKDIMQKNFDSFANHGSYVNEKADPLGAHLFNMENNKWKNLRSKLTPTFSSGKMKMMFQTMVNCTSPLVDLLKQDSSAGKPVDIKEVVARFTTDIIGSAAFGVDCNSLKDPNCEFREVGKTITKVTWRKIVGSFLPKQILKAINFRTRSKEAENFFVNFVNSVVNYRESNNVYRKDFMHMMLQLKNRGKVVDDEKIMDDNKKGDFMKINEIAAQCYVFFIGGFDTSSTLMTFALLELANDQPMQDKLREEMTRVIKKHGGITYDAIMEMTYLDQVVNESLRKHPPAVASNRECNKNYVIQDTGVQIEKGTNVIVPIFCIHHDPDNYPEPNKFDPDRFSPENKTARHPYAFIPFGEGPRMCIGARFGLLQSKVGLTSILTSFKVTLCSRTKYPVEYDMSGLLLSAKGDVWLNMTEIKN